MNNSELFLIAVPNNTEANDFRYFQYDDNEGFLKSDINGLAKENRTIVTFSIERSLLKKKIEPKTLNPTFVDITSLAYYYFGHPKKEFGTDVPWSLHQLLKDYYADYSELLSICRQLKGFSSKKQLNESDCQIFLQRLAGRYFAIKKDLEKRGEWERFENCEIKAFNIFLRSHLDGIKVDKSKIEEKLSNIEADHFKKLYELRTHHGFKGTTASYEEIKRYLSQTGESILSEETDIFSFLKARKHLDPKFSLILDLVKDERTRRSLLDISLSSSDYINPTYDIMGTITGRILVNDPRLQILKKEHRDVIVPETGKQFIYFDYSCFEPAILASISNDQYLKDLCNAGDLYESLANDIMGQPGYRSIFKVVFLAFSFGMEKDGLVGFLSELLGKSRVESTTIFEKLFSQFHEITRWKERVWREMETQGYSASINGNRRYRKHTGKLSPAERRWAVNQIIQGTASYILKESIISIAEKFPVKIILPMHDAILIQAEAEYLSSKKQELRTEMESTFKKHLPGVNVVVKEEMFFRVKGERKTVS